jgi:hypothetical protein
MRIALIKNKIVENIIICDSIDFAKVILPDYEYVDVTNLYVSTEFIYENNKFTNPNEEV